MESDDWSSSKEAGSMIAITAGSDPTTTNDQRTGREGGGKTEGHGGHHTRHSGTRQEPKDCRDVLNSPFVCSE